MKPRRRRQGRPWCLPQAAIAACPRAPHRSARQTSSKRASSGCRTTRAARYSGSCASYSASAGTGVSSIARLRVGWPSDSHILPAARPRHTRSPTLNRPCRGYSPLATGLTFLPCNLILIVPALVATRLVDRVGYRRTMAMGMGTVIVGLLLLARITPEAAYLSTILPGLLLWGAGLGFAQIAAVGAGTIGHNRGRARSSRWIDQHRCPTRHGGRPLDPRDGRNDPHRSPRQRGATNRRHVRRWLPLGLHRRQILAVIGMLVAAFVARDSTGAHSNDAP